jgi:hypothetical protein
MEELRFSEKLLLLTLDPEKQSFPSASSAIMKFGLPAAIFYELTEMKIFNLDGDTLEPIEPDPVGDEVLDMVLNSLPRKASSLKNSIAKLSGKSKKIRDLLINSLIRKQVIMELTDRKNRFRFWYEKPLQNIRMKLQEILMYGQEGDPETRTLIALITACKIHKKVLKKMWGFRSNTPKLKQITEENVFADALKSTLSGTRFHIIFTLITFLIILAKQLCSG